MGDGKTRESRLAAISNILSGNHIGSQEELVERLKDKGYAITQATLSRDLKALQVVKVPAGDGYRYRIHSGHSASVKGNTAPVVSVDASGNLAVIKTGPGFAAAIASTIDNNVTDPNIMGTIAGDDTVLLILRDGALLADTVGKISEFIPGMQNKLLL